ncbi:MAG: alpha-2-macroglobulin [Dysgonamonadaceae bacterium]|jgi:uncharacterized protein YfaS (alpha-2-macroglobulin family)|nr:alpha-2-macroglobulin [Dysgonamonadaceae bacterium]
MKRNLFIFTIIASIFSIHAQNPKWEEVASLEKQALPQSASAMVNQIYQEALKTGNSPELIKTFIYQLKYETAIDKDRLPERIQEMEAFATTDNNKVEQAILYSLLAKLYFKYYQANAYLINRRTAITGYIPDDMREWSGNLFIRKINDLSALSLIPDQELQKTNVSDYKEILTKGEDSRNLRPTLYDFLLYNRIEILNNINANHQSKLSQKTCFLPAKEFINLNIQTEKQDFASQILKLYQQLLIFRLEENNPEALLSADLDRLDFVKTNTQTDDAGKLYLEALDRLKNQYEKADFCVEILYREAIYYLNERNTEKIATDYLKKAYEICESGIKTYPDYKKTGLLKNLLNQITESNLSVQSDNAVYPGKELTLKINYKNFNTLTVEIYKIKMPVNVSLHNREGQYSKAGTLIEKKEIELTNNYPYLSSDTTIHIPAKDMGLYEYVIYADGLKEEKANRQFSVSRLATVSRAIDNQWEFLVVDRLTGKPMEGAQINFYKRNNNVLVLNKTKTIITDKLGIASVLSDKESNFYNASFEKDTALGTSSVPWISTYRFTEKTNSKLNLFTDRSIYRPGQTVYFKGIAILTGKETEQVVSNKTYTLTLRDANTKEITQQTFKTNEFGSISGEFTLPQGVLTGHFTLQSNNDGGYISFRVEEYKRPAFDIQFEDIDKTYAFGDEITISGNAKTFSGINLQAATVKYRITRQNHWLFARIWRDPVQVTEGEVKTTDGGDFFIRFIAEKTFEDRALKNVSYTYIVETSVTDTNGETQSAQTHFYIGDKSMHLSIVELPDVIEKEKNFQIKINAFNLSETPVSVQGAFEIYRLTLKDKTQFNWSAVDWEQDKKILSGNFESGKEIDLSALKILPSGRYRILVKANDDKGRNVETQQDFSLASLDDKQPPIPVYQWLITPKTTCEAGETAEIIYGTSAQNVYVLYELFKNNTKLAVSRFVLNNENKKIKIPFLESYGDGISASFTFVKENKVFTKNVVINKKQPDKNLNLKMEVFRDRLTPGQKEEWKISLKDASQNPAVAELLAGMYDASLDKIQKHSWNFNPTRNIDIRSIYNQQGNEFNSSHDSFQHSKEDADVPAFNYNSFNWFGFNLTANTFKLRKSSDVLFASAVNDVFESASVELSEVQAEAKQANEIQEPQEVQIRQNFNETAFFYPHLKTNETGETLISFTVPESNTTWKLMGLAHTQDLKYGQIVKEIISQKQLMITPNIPRFIRCGDKTTITTNISNLSEETISGNVIIDFFDPVTNKKGFDVIDNSRPFVVEAGKTVSVDWTFDVPGNPDLTGIRIVAQSPLFSDGEQHLLPVLPNRMMVTESLPLNVQGGQTRRFSFDNLAQKISPTLENYRLTLEFSSNPVWYAIQALPTLATPQTDNILSWFAACYSNTLATQIVNSTPKIKSIIDIWTKQGGTKETLLSNLEKNEELKAILLEETPWIMEAKSESEQKQRLSLLFDVNRSGNLKAQAWDKLKSLQTEEGGWPWFKGMQSNISITQWLLYAMKELKETEELKEIQLKAIHFIDRKFKQHFEAEKKNHSDWKKKSHFSTYELEYLFVRSLYKNIPLEETKEAADFYTGIIEKNRPNTANFYHYALAAMLMQRNGNIQTAQAILKSLREHAGHKQDFGMYWANNYMNSFMTQSAVCVHTFIMEAFDEVGANDTEMDEMKLWLLKQKQTQQWESVPATVNAIRMLLKTGNNLLESEGKVNIQLGNKTVDTSRKEAGTGYFKEIWEAATTENFSSLHQITISKSDKGPAWGAIYWQYFEDLDKITSAKNELNVDKMLFIEKITATGKSLIPVNESNPLKTGNKVTVRLTVRTDRDLEYVLLKDMRASCFEPVHSLSEIQWKQGLIYYQAPKDASMNFFFSALPKGTHVFEYSLYVTRPGDYSNGITTIQCLYAPEFVSHTTGKRVTVK